MHILRLIPRIAFVRTAAVSPRAATTTIAMCTRSSHDAMPCYRTHTAARAHECIINSEVIPPEKTPAMCINMIIIMQIARAHNIAGVHRNNMFWSRSKMLWHCSVVESFFFFSNCASASWNRRASAFDIIVASHKTVSHSNGESLFSFFVGFNFSVCWWCGAV